MHNHVPTMVEAGAVAALCNILAAPSDGALESVGYFYVAHLLHMLTGLSGAMGCGAPDHRDRIGARLVTWHNIPNFIPQHQHWASHQHH